ncbi:MAG: DNA gyrase inhibitor YacG [Gammaproteobacteria bacterium]|nr:DNA gyrase inhibitor YacG [Gammaproteobacteria bacterium]
MNQKTIITCPTCKKTSVWDTQNAFRPFCSERCKLIDLGDWASEKHRVAGDPVSNQDEDDTNQD